MTAEEARLLVQPTIFASPRTLLDNQRRKTTTVRVISTFPFSANLQRETTKLRGKREQHGEYRFSTPLLPNQLVGSLARVCRR